jgi:hypothetical protein
MAYEGRSLIEADGPEEADTVISLFLIIAWQ